jgi:hypothetical protein
MTDQLRVLRLFVIVAGALVLVTQVVLAMVTQ